jgi:primosomal protein N' (replication factor Y)
MNHTIASVIVDVPVAQTDRAFDYAIPSLLQGTIEQGMRVIVPFGPRKIQGFVTELKNESDSTKLKEIIEPMDLEPPLTVELLMLADWLKNRTMCYKISALQSMLPAAMKAKYKKQVHLLEDAHGDQLSEKIHTFFAKTHTQSWESAAELGLLTELKKLAKQGLVEIQYLVKSKAKKKTIKKFRLLLWSNEELAEWLSSLPSTAKKQGEIGQYFLDKQVRTVDWNDLKNEVNVSLATMKALVNKNIIEELDIEVYRDPYEHSNFKKSKPLDLTIEQAKARELIQESIDLNEHKTFLLHGVTGSGKTEIYLQSIDEVIQKGKEAIVLVPEIALTPQMVDRFKGRFSDQVAVLHSGLSIGEKYDEWRKIHRKEVKVVVGARSAIFAPFENIGMIIIDEEHENSYKQEENPRYHARDVAIERGKYHHCPVILGSATPSLESFARATKNVYTLLTLPTRVNQRSLPSVSVVDMREELKKGNRSMFSIELFDKIKDRLKKEEQIVLFLNRRGHSSFVMCRDCGFVVQCPNCDISLTYHRKNQKMKCHYCGFEESTPKTCPECKSEHIRFFGTGTQKVEEELAKLIPEARVVRMDVDTTTKKGSHERLLKQFEEKKADILLGTQMIAKGLDFPSITLVGVLSADTMLHLPDFRASEKTFQLLTQVSGRAGRHHLIGEVVIQTYSKEHYSIQLASLQDYDLFYKEEMRIRHQSGYPPFYFLALLTISDEDLMKTVKEAEKIAKYLSTNLSDEAVILGPTASPLSKINNRYRYQCLIKYKREASLSNVLSSIHHHYQSKSKEGLTVAIDMEPYMMM